MMNFYAIFTAIAIIIPYTHAFWKGFNVAAQNPDGSCKTKLDWEIAFRKLQDLPQGITSVRLYASSDCNTLENAVPAAIATGMQILVGIWTEDGNHYEEEKTALQAAINTHGIDWIIAISVGSEDLYRGDTDASALAGQISDVRSMIKAMGHEEVEIGHVDTPNAWLDSRNKDVIVASDFIGVDSYPYFQNVPVDAANNSFWESITSVQDHVDSVSTNKAVWVTETGWPVSGSNRGLAVTSTQNAGIYWREVACAAFQSINTFWYVYQDFSATPSFGVFGSDGNAIYDLFQCVEQSSSCEI